MQKRIVANDILIPEIIRLIAEGSKVRFTPKGMSMLPFIRGERDSVVLIAANDIKKGDIVLAQVGHSYVIHRIVDLNDKVVTLMGDGNILGVEKCRYSDVLARAESIIKDGRTIDCRSESHLRKAGIWGKLKPVRPYLLAIYKRIIL